MVNKVKSFFKVPEGVYELQHEILHHCRGSIKKELAQFYPEYKIDPPINNNSCIISHDSKIANNYPALTKNQSQNSTELQNSETSPIPKAQISNSEDLANKQPIRSFVLEKCGIEVGVVLNVNKTSSSLPNSPHGTEISENATPPSHSLTNSRSIENLLHSSNISNLRWWNYFDEEEIDVFSESKNKTHGKTIGKAALGSATQEGAYPLQTKTDFKKIEMDGVFLSVQREDKIFLYNLKYSEVPFRKINLAAGKHKFTCHKLNQSALSIPSFSSNNKTLEYVIGFSSGISALYRPRIASEPANTSNACSAAENKTFNTSGLEKSAVTCLAWIPPAKRGIFVPPHFVLNYNFPYLIPPAESSSSINNNPSSPTEATKNIAEIDNLLKKTPESPEHNNLTVSEFFFVCHLSGKVFAFNKNYLEEDKDFSNFLEIDFSKNEQEKNSNNLKKSNPEKKGFRVAVNKIPKRNPIATFSISEKPINDVALTLFGRYAAFACDDCYLHVVDLENLRLFAKFESYFGAFKCCSFSQDNRLLIAGGEDDMLHVFNFKARREICRGIGHYSSITKCIFDPFSTFGKEKENTEESRTEMNEVANSSLGITSQNTNYRVVSVGSDCRLLCWDFCDGNFSNFSNSSGTNVGMISPNFGNFASFSKDFSTSKIVAAKKLRSKLVKQMEPVATRRVHFEPVCSLFCLKKLIFTMDNMQMVKIWKKNG